MTPSAPTAPDSAFASATPARSEPREVRPYFWSVRRELWENRSLYRSPIAVAVVVLFGFLVRTIPRFFGLSAVAALDPEKQRALLEKPYDLAAMTLIATGFLVGLYYCVDALHGERHDRALLFWRSLPVSDRTAVLAKASVPLLVLPAIIFTLVLATQAVMLVVDGAALLVNGENAAAYSTFPYPIVLHGVFLFYGLIVLALWHAPVYAWVLLVSAWARRAVLVWVVLPPLALVALEGMVSQTSWIRLQLGNRLTGGIERAFDFDADGKLDGLAELTPGRFLATPGLWLGLLLAATFLALAVKLRRERGPT